MAESFTRLHDHFNIDGWLSPFHTDGQPVIVHLPGITTPFVIVFSTSEQLRKEMAYLLPGEEYKIKQIDDAQEFCESIWEGGARIMANPTADFEKGTTRWTEIMSNKDPRITGRN